MIKTRGMTQEEQERLLPQVKQTLDEFNAARVAAQEAKNPQCNRSTYALDRSLVQATLSLRQAESRLGILYVGGAQQFLKVLN